MMALLSSDFGRDVSCTTALRTGRFASKFRLVGEACYRRLTTPRGTLRGGEEEADYGLDLTELVGTTNPTSTAAALPGRISGELLKDERIVKVDTEVTVTRDGAATSFAIEIRVETTEGPFTLALLATDVTVELIGMREET
jgi:hypothetical protein